MLSEVKVQSVVQVQTQISESKWKDTALMKNKPKQKKPKKLSLPPRKETRYLTASHLFNLYETVNEQIYA